MRDLDPKMSEARDQNSVRSEMHGNSAPITNNGDQIIAIMAYLYDAGIIDDAA